MKLLEPIPNLGPCEGRWITAFGVHRRCTYRASETYESPCGHVHLLCATCAYALERGIGTWDGVEDFLQFRAPSGAAPMRAAEGATLLDPLEPRTATGTPVRRHPATRRRRERIPLHVVFAGIVALAALIVVGVPSILVAAPTTVGTAVLLYSVALRYTWRG